MIVMGSALGTGLFLGSGTAIAMAGPAVILTYACLLYTSHHMRLINNEDLVTVTHRRQSSALTQITGMIHTAVARRVHLNHCLLYTSRCV